MNDMNNVSLTGRLTTAIEIKYTTGGTAVGKFNLAVNRSKKVNGQWTDVADFFECAWYSKSAEGLAQYLPKGKQVAITGQMRQERWTKDGQNYSRIVVIVQTLSLMGSKEDSGKKPNKQNNQPLPILGPEDFDSDQIPF